MLRRLPIATLFPVAVLVRVGVVVGVGVGVGVGAGEGVAEGEAEGAGAYAVVGLEEKSEEHPSELQSPASISSAYFFTINTHPSVLLIYLTS